MQAQGVVLNIEIGIIYELQKQNVLSEKQAQKAIQILKQNYIQEHQSKERTDTNETGSRLL